MTLDSFVRDAATGLLLPPLARKQVLPYGDLQILNQPETLQHVTHDLISALAVMVAQAPDRPRLLSADVKGRLRSSGFINQVTALVSPFTGGGTTFNVADSSDYYPGQLVAAVSQTPNGPSCNGMVVTGVPDIHTIIVSSSCVGQNFVVGDFLVGTPDVRVASNVFPNQITGTDTVILAGAPNPGDSAIGMVGTVAGHKRLMVDPNRSLDTFLRTGLTQPAAASLTLPNGSSAYALVLVMLNAGVLNNTAAASTPILQIWNGPSGTGVLMYDEALSIAAGGLQVVDRPNRLIRAAAGNAITIVFDRGGANLLEWINAGAMLEKL